MARRASKSPRWTARVQIGRTPAGATDLHTLDSFTDASIAEWQSFARAQADYQYALYFDLEAQRATRHEDIRDALQSEPPTTVSVENWRRLVNFKHSMSGLSPVGSLYRSGRFNIGEDVNPALFSPFPALYVAEDLETAYREYHGVAVGHKIDGLTPEELSLEDDGSWVALLLLGHVNNVFDATKVKSFRKFCYREIQIIRPRPQRRESC